MLKRDVAHIAHVCCNSQPVTVCSAGHHNGPACTADGRARFDEARDGDHLKRQQLAGFDERAGQARLPGDRAVGAQLGRKAVRGGLKQLLRLEIATQGQQTSAQPAGRAESTSVPERLLDRPVRPSRNPLIHSMASSIQSSISSVDVYTGADF